MGGRDVYVAEVVESFRDHVEIMGPVALDRITGAFADIEREARERADKVYLEELSKPGDGSGIDSIAEMAHGVGVEHLRALTALKQGMVNLLAVGLYHSFEQQRTEYKATCGRSGVVPVPIDETDVRVRWPKVEELRLVANTVKHAEGDSCDRLRKVRPDLIGVVLFGMPIPVKVVAPMAGQDLYVRPEDIREYASALVELWEAVSAAHR